MLKFSIFILSLSGVIFFTSAYGQDTAKNSIHAQPWIFGQSSDRKSEIWHKGKSASSINEGARVSSKAKKSAEEIIDEKSQKKKNSFGLSWKDESGTWKVTPDQKKLHPDEEHVRDKRHVLGAYAGIEAGKDLNIKLGPELILKDDYLGDEAAKSDQPDSALGLGMKFQYDF